MISCSCIAPFYAMRFDEPTARFILWDSTANNSTTCNYTNNQ
jgi:hypothetical protein